MAKSDRYLLESVAVDIVLGSLERLGDTASRAQAWREVESMTDCELVNFITA